MPTAYSQSTAATIPAIDTKAKEVLAKVQNLLDGNESLYKISINSKIQTVGLFADCSDEYFSEPGNACIFSVDTIRLKQNSDTTGKIVAVCVDNVDFNSKPPIVNCTPLTVDISVLTNSQGVGASFGLSGETTTPAGVSLEIGAGVGVSLEWENGVFQRQPLTIPLPKSAGLEFSGQKSGGNALTDGGFDPILSSKFVVLKTQDIEGEVEFTGTFPSKMKLVLGNFHDGISNPVCDDKNGKRLAGCPDNFSNVLKSINTFSTPQVFSAKYTPATSETTFTFVDYNNNQHNPFSSKITNIGLVTDIQTQTVIDTVNDLVEQGDLSQRTGRAILWLLNAAKTLEESGDKETAISKLNAATQRINQLAQRNQLTPSSAQSILGSIQDAINNIENPPGDGDPDITSPFFGQNIKEDISQLNALSESVVDEVVEIDQATNALAKLVDRGLGDKLLEITLNEIKKIPNLVPKIVEKFVGGVDAISNIGEIKTVIGETKSTVDDVERGVDTILTDLDNAFTFSTSCPEGTTTVGVGPAALCTTQPSCPTGTAPNNAGTECVIRTGGSFPACPSGSVDNLVGECGPAPTPSTCPSGFIKKSEVTCGATQNPSCPSGTAPNNAGTECVIRTGGSFPTCPSGSVDNLAGECGPVPHPSTCPSGFKIIGTVCGKDTIAAVGPTCPSGEWNGVVCVGGDPCDSGFDLDIFGTCIHDECHNPGIGGICFEGVHHVERNPSCSSGLSGSSVTQKCEGPRTGGSAARCPSGTSFNAAFSCVIKTPCPSGSVDNLLGECGPAPTPSTCPSGFIKKSEITCGVSQNPGCPSGTAPNLAGTQCVIRTGIGFPACPSGSTDNLVGECGPVPHPSTCPSGFIKKSEITCGVAGNPSCPTDFDNIAGTCTKPAV